MNYVINHIPEATPNNRRPRIAMVPEYITIHSTANPNSSARNERAWLTNPQNSRTASWHIVVDDKEAVEAIPLNEVAWHAGDGRNGTGNRKTIGIEICESGDRAKTIQNTAELVAKMLHYRDWGVDRLRRHYDWSKKNCPRIMSANNWEGWTGFKLQVERELEKLKGFNVVKVRYNGETYMLDGFVKDKRNYVQIRQVAETVFNKKVDWDNTKQEVIIHD